jgi:hypothetical protein
MHSTLDGAWLLLFRFGTVFEYSWTSQDDTPSKVHLLFREKSCAVKAKDLWEVFRHTNFMEILDNECRYIERKDAWNDLGFSRRNIRELLDMPGAETKIYGVEKWALLLALFRSRILSWNYLPKIGPVPRNDQWKESTPHVFTIEDITSIESKIKRIRTLLQRDDGVDLIDHLSQLKSLPDDFRLVEDIDFEVDWKNVLGYGGNASVFGTRYPVGSAMANAALKVTRRKPGVGVNEEITELHYMLMVRHENIITIYGWTELGYGSTHVLG